MGWAAGSPKSACGVHASPQSPQLQPPLLFSLLPTAGGRIALHAPLSVLLATRVPGPQPAALGPLPPVQPVHPLAGKHMVAGWCPLGFVSSWPLNPRSRRTPSFILCQQSRFRVAHSSCHRPDLHQATKWPRQVRSVLPTHPSPLPSHPHSPHVHTSPTATPPAGPARHRRLWRGAHIRPRGGLCQPHQLLVLPGYRPGHRAGAGGQPQPYFCYCSSMLSLQSQGDFVRTGHE